jgi:hypothetical protein
VKNKRNLIEAVTVCVYLADKLKYCLNNRKYFDRWIIVTVADDYETIELCKSFSIEYCFTKRVFQKGALFAKGKAINEGLALLNKSGWLIQLDCDIVLPYNFRDLVNSIPLNKKNVSSLFGVKARRALGVHAEYQSTRDYETYFRFHQVFLEGSDQFRSEQSSTRAAFFEFQKKYGLTDRAGSLKNQWNNFVDGNWTELVYPFEGNQVFHIGYFQLFHSEKYKIYPETSIDANHDDITFREKFPISHRQFIDCECVHLGLVCEGRHFFRHLDNYVSGIKNKKDFAYLNKLHQLKIKRGSKLSYNQNFAKRGDVSRRSYLISPHGQSQYIESAGRNWTVWGKSFHYYTKGLRKINSSFVESYEFYPKISRTPWFGFSIEAIKTFDRSNYELLCFDLKIVDLDCGIEVGFGEAKKMEWVAIDLSKFRNNTWRKVQLSFTKINPLTHLDTLIAFRNQDPYSEGEIHLSDIFFK